MPNLAQVVITAIIAFSVLFAGITTLSIFDGEAENAVQRTNEPLLLDGAGQYTTIDDSVGDSETVYNSLGRAVSLTGASDSYVQSDSEITIASDDNWTVAVWARVDAGASTETMTAVSANGRVVIDYNGTDGNWTAWYYDEGARNSYVVNVSAPNQPSNFSLVSVSSNGTHLSIYRNTTAGDVKNITTSNIADAPVNSTNWNGRLDEIRTFDDPLNATQRQALVNDPVAPLPNATRTARVMFDESGVSSQLIFFTDARMTQSNASIVDGLPGSVMQGQTLLSAITGTTDYVWDDDGPRIYVVEGGELDGAPVAYATYTYYPLQGAQRTFSDRLGRAISIAGIVPGIMLLVVVVSYLLLLRD